MQEKKEKTTTYATRKRRLRKRDISIDNVQGRPKNRIRQIRANSDKFGQIWTDTDKSGQIWTNSDKHENKTQQKEKIPAHVDSTTTETKRQRNSNSFI